MTILGDTWKLRCTKGLFCNGEPIFGLCSPSKRTIFVEKNQDKKDMINTVVHEVLHALMPLMIEEHIRASADDVTQVLDDCGFLAV